MVAAAPPPYAGASLKTSSLVLFIVIFVLVVGMCVVIPYCVKTRSMLPEKGLLPGEFKDIKELDTSESLKHLELPDDELRGFGHVKPNMRLVETHHHEMAAAI